MPRITFHEEAESELNEAALYYEDRAVDLGLTLLDEVEKTSQRIPDNPMAYRAVDEEIHQAPVARFPYSVLYVIESDKSIRIIAVAHQKRRPGYWRKRLRIGS